MLHHGSRLETRLVINAELQQAPWLMLHHGSRLETNKPQTAIQSARPGQTNRSTYCFVVLCLFLLLCQATDSKGKQCEGCALNTQPSWRNSCKRGCLLHRLCHQNPSPIQTRIHRFGVTRSTKSAEASGLRCVDPKIRI